MKKIVSGLCIFSFSIVCLLLSGCTSMKELDNMTVGTIDIGAVKNGEYRAAQRFFPVTANVKLTVRDGIIEDLKLLGHFHGPNHGADAILNRVKEKQSLQVDAITGSTYSSKVILLAIQKALEKGL